MIYILFLISIVVALGWKLLPPSNLYKIPSVPLIPFLLSFINQEPSDKRSERLVLPILYKHGITKLWLNRWIVVISDTIRAKEIFNKTNIYEKDTLRAGAEHTVGARLFGSNIVFTSGEEWKRHRKAANPAFHRSWSTELVGNCCEVLLDKIQLEKEPIEILPFLKRMTLDALGKAIFNFDFKAVEQPEGKYVKIYTSLMQEFRKIVYAFLPFLESPILNIRANAHARVTEFRALISEVLEQKKKELQSGGEVDESKADLLTLMVKANMFIMEDGEPLLSNEEIINDTVVFFVAGHDTTANTLAFILYYLSKHQDIQQKAREEVIRVMGKRTGPPSLEEQKEMHYLLLRRHWLIINLVMSLTNQQLKLGLLLEVALEVVLGLHFL
ncbi:cytochrome P450 [Neoconidiobolus thromboides FSU 785]|nr:cytochrome P450 [Neoconidiobolus thromboides FSU 785]